MTEETDGEGNPAEEGEIVAEVEGAVLKEKVIEAAPVSEPVVEDAPVTEPEQPAKKSRKKKKD